MKVCRAKFRCTEVRQSPEGATPGTHVTLVPVTTGSEENKSFYNMTPSGAITMGTVNPNVQFTEGTEYYVDFTDATPAVTEAAQAAE